MGPSISRSRGLRAQVERSDRGSGPNDPNSYARLYVGSLNFALTDDDLRQVFQPFGAIEYVDLHKDPMTGKSKGYAFVQCGPIPSSPSAFAVAEWRFFSHRFRQPQDARTAMEKMNNFALAGRPLRVEVRPRLFHARHVTRADIVAQIKAQPPPGLMMTGGFTGGGGGRGGGGGYGGAEDRLEDPSASPSPYAVGRGPRLSWLRTVGGNMNQITRIELMHKLARTDAPAGLSVTDMSVPNSPFATKAS